MTSSPDKLLDEMANALEHSQARLKYLAQEFNVSGYLHEVMKRDDDVLERYRQHKEGGR
jgi:hypothetical protein